MPLLPVDYSEYCNKAGGSPIEHCIDSLSAALNNKQNIWTDTYYDDEQALGHDLLISAKTGKFASITIKGPKVNGNYSQ
jgi:hypothetical protein